LRFNCSHSGDWALVALARGIELGVDLEQHQPMSDAADVAKKFFTTAEINELNHLPFALKTAGFFNCWTRKEAFVKARGEGLGFGLARFDVSLAPGGPARILRVDQDRGESCGWVLGEFNPAPGFVGAVVVQSEMGRLQ